MKSDQHFPPLLARFTLTFCALLTACLSAWWTPAQGACSPPPGNMLAWWSADGTASDLVGAHGATLENGTYFDSGYVIGAFALDGIDDWVQTPLDAQPSALPFTTWEAWVFPTASDGRRQILSTDDGGFDRSLLIENGSFAVFTGSGSWLPVQVDLHAWQHVAVVYTPRAVRFYKNGTEYTLGEAPIRQETGNLLNIGRNPGFGEYFSGLIDEIGVYDRALTAAEITSIVSAGTEGKCRADSDGDGLFDVFEAFYGLDPSSADGDDGAEGDPDSDGLDNLSEQEVGANPRNADTDGDGLPDGTEDGGGIYVSSSQTGTSPVNPDSDGDGLMDGVETKTGTFVSYDASTRTGDTGTDPNDSDSDDDTYEDGYELVRGTNPNNPADYPDSQIGRSIGTVIVGDAGNPNDPLTGNGRVNYEYHIGTYEVTHSQYTVFLNAVDPHGENPNGIYNGGMIQFDAGALPGSKYSVLADFGSKPVGNVSFWDAARFCNWLTSGDTETGVYILTADGIANNTITRNATAWAAGGVAIANKNEWYKAAYYQPAANGGDSDNYWLYPTASNFITTSDANYNNSVGTATDVGSYSASSYYGTFDQAGNEFEWTEEIDGPTHRIIRGGRFDFPANPMQSVDPYTTPASAGSGFRVTSLEPIVEESALKVTLIERMPDQFIRLVWQSQPGKSYDILASSTLSGFELVSASVSADSADSFTDFSFHDPASATETRRFYIIREKP